MSGGARPAVAGLRLAATPTFAVMAAVTALSDIGRPDMICSTGHGVASGMISMYLLMSAFHLPSWLTPASNRLQRTRAVAS